MSHLLGSFLSLELQIHSSDVPHLAMMHPSGRSDSTILTNLHPQSCSSTRSMNRSGESRLTMSIGSEYLIFFGRACKNGLPKVFTGPVDEERRSQIYLHVRFPVPIPPHALSILQYPCDSRITSVTLSYQTKVIRLAFFGRKHHHHNP